MNKAKKKIIFASAIAAGLIIIAGICLLADYKKPCRIAFYQLQSNVETETKTLIEKYISGMEKAPSVEFRQLDPKLSLKTQLKKDRHIALVFAPAGASLAEAYDRIVKPQPSIYAGMPTSIRGFSDTVVPLLLDSFETVYLKESYSNNEENIPENFGEVFELSNAFKAGGKRYALYCAGADEHSLGSLVSALLESRYGIDALNELTKKISEEEKAGTTSIFNAVLNAPLTENGRTMASILSELASWRKKEYLHPEWYEMSKRDTVFFMENKSAAGVFMHLSMHRDIPHPIISNYQENFFPSGRIEGNRSRSLIFDVITGAFADCRYKKDAEISEKILKDLVSQNTQSVLCMRTGLAPVNSIAETNDRQQTFARLWGAAAESVTPGLYRAFISDENRRVFFEEMRGCLSITGIL